MKLNQDLTGDKRLIRNEDCSVEFMVEGEGYVELTAAANASATSLICKPIRYALADNTPVYFERTGITAVLSAAALVGAITLSIDALAGPLAKGDDGVELVDPTGWAMRWRLQIPEQDDVLIEKTTGASQITVVASQDTLSKRVKVTLAPADTADLELATRNHELWRTDSGYATMLASGQAELAET